MPQIADEAMMAALNRANTGMIVNFYLHPVQDEVKSTQEGRPIFEEVEFIEIRVPGDKDEIRQRQVRAADKHQYPQQYAAFKNKLEQPANGTPLEQVPFLTRAQVLEFKALGLKTAENIRDMPDVHASKFMGSHALRKRISDFLAAAAGNAPIERLNAELAERDAKIDMLMKALKEQGDRLDALTKAQRK